MPGIRVGLASVDFTPEPGLPLMGNFRDDYAARGVHDPLYAKAAVFDDGCGVRAGVLAIDICMLDRQNVAFLRRTIGSQCDMPPENVLIHATHTHSAPAASGKLGLAEEVSQHADAIERFLRRAASAVGKAAEALGEVTIEVGYAAENRVCFNRRLRRCDGTTQMNWEALQPDFDPEEIAGTWGPVDPQMLCLTVRGEQKPVAAVVNYGLHPAILAGDNWLYSADFPGYMAEALKRTLGSEFTCIFLNGCCGDVNHVDYRDRMQGRGYQQAQRVGYMLGAAAHEAIRTATPIDANRLAVSREMVPLRRLAIGPAEQQWCRRVLEQARHRPAQGLVDGVPDAYYAKLRLEMSRQQHEPDHAEVMVIRIGEAAIVGLPGEAFCQLGMEIKRRSPAAHTLVAGLSNDAVGYLPTRESFAQGGYETMPGSTFYEPGTGERLVESALSQLERLFQPPDGVSRV